MRSLTIFAITAVLAFAACSASSEEGCSSAPTITQLEPLTDEEKSILRQLDDIQNDPSVVAKAEAETQVPLEAFGGCGEQRFLVIIPTDE